MFGNIGELLMQFVARDDIGLDVSLSLSSPPPGARRSPYPLKTLVSEDNIYTLLACGACNLVAKHLTTVDYKPPIREPLLRQYKCKSHSTVAVTNNPH